MSIKIYKRGENMERKYNDPKATENFYALLSDLSKLPFSFVYGGEKYEGFSEEFFTFKDKDVISSGEKEMHTLKFDFLKTLELTLVLTHYFSHGVTEWTVWLENV